MTVRIPRGELLRARVVTDPAVILEAALDKSLTGYATLSPHDTLLLGGDARGVLTFEAGVPVLAYNTATERGGPAALADLAVPGPYRVELYALDPVRLRPAHATPALRVPPGMPAEELADAPALADRTRAAAPDDRADGGRSADAVASFLADKDRIAAIRERARAEAAERAAEWGLADHLEDTSDPAGPSGDGADPNPDPGPASGPSDPDGEQL